MAQSFRSLILDQVGSTNREAFALAEAGEAGPVWIMARRQTAGRGRADRRWVSPPGNFHASLLVRLDCPPRVTPQLSLAAGVATFDAIRQAANGAGPSGLRLKWPNDVLIGQAKCAGILVEASAAVSDCSSPCGEVAGVGESAASEVPQSPRTVPLHAAEATPRRAPRPVSLTAVIGIGVDLASHPADLGRAATHLAEHGLPMSPEAMLGHLAEAMQHWLAVWDCGRGFSGVRQAWLERAGAVGEMCTVDTGRERIVGTFADLDAEGGLVIADGHGQRRAVTFGEVQLNAAAPQDGN